MYTIIYDIRWYNMYMYIHFTKGSLLAGYLEFYFAKQRGGLDPLSLNDQEKGTLSPPPSKGTLAICLVSLFTQQPLRSVSSSSPPHHHHHSTWNSDFSTSIFQVPNGAMKVTGSSIHRYRKRDIGVYANTDRVFFPARCVGLTIDNVYLQMAI